MTWEGRETERGKRKKKVQETGGREGERYKRGEEEKKKQEGKGSKRYEREEKSIQLEPLPHVWPNNQIS